MIFYLLFLWLSDNGSEFRNQYMFDLVNVWDGNCKLVYGRPRNPSCQGLVEQANGTAEIKVAAMMAQIKDKNWVKLIPKLMYNLNTQKHSGKKIDISLFHTFTY